MISIAEPSKAVSPSREKSVLSVHSSCLVGCLGWAVPSQDLLSQFPACYTWPGRSSLCLCAELQGWADRALASRGVPSLLHQALCSSSDQRTLALEVSLESSWALCLFSVFNTWIRHIPGLLKQCWRALAFHSAVIFNLGPGGTLRRD